jgi:hypothetical protein
MVQKKVSSEEADPTLSHGWAIFCEVVKYNNHLVKYGDQLIQVRLRCYTYFVSLELSYFCISGLHVSNTTLLKMQTLNAQTIWPSWGLAASIAPGTTSNAQTPPVIYRRARSEHFSCYLAV